MEDVPQALMAPAETPEEYSRLVAEDRHLAAEYAQLRAVNDSTDALQVVVDAAADIVGRCLHMPTTGTRKRSLVLSLKVIEQVGERSDRLGDEVQAAWCTLLHHEILGGEPPSA